MMFESLKDFSATELRIVRRGFMNVRNMAQQGESVALAAFFNEVALLLHDEMCDRNEAHKKIEAELMEIDLTDDKWTP